LFSTYSLTAESQMRPDKIEYLSDKTVFTLGNMTYTLPLTGQYNLYNALAAISTALLLDVSPTDIKRALMSFRGIKGRLEAVENKRGIHAYVDFAHTPNALKEVLTNIKSHMKTGENLIVVFGAASERDVSKRPIMGLEASKLADKIVLTAEDSRFEDPTSIAKQILKGVPSNKRKNTTIEPDREKAIIYAVNVLAKKGDWIVVCGKGHEESMNLDGFEEIPWSDREALLNALNGQ
jgi:UDP-N-acetylmuramoyl-L-alanyl-D-glutamate--2,6-diaminopimelate ligase